MPPKRQHYVPRSYLSDFTDPKTPEGYEPYLWVYDREEQTPFARAPHKLAVRKYYYSFSPAPAERDHSVEELLGRVESAALPVLRSLANGTAPPDLGDDDRGSLAFFIGMMSVRIPGFRDSIEGFMADLMRSVAMAGASDADYFERTMRRALEEAGKPIPEDIESVRKFVLSGEYEVKADPVVSLQALISMSPTVASYAYRCRWRVLRAPNGSRFVTSDRPVVLVSTERFPGVFGWSTGWATPWMEATLPLGPDACLLMSLHHPEGEEQVSAEVVGEVNLRTAAFATEEVYASEEFDPSILERPPDWEWWSPVTEEVVDLDRGQAGNGSV